MSTWLRDHLIRSGVMTEKGVTRSARVRVCRRCGADVICGLTDPAICAIEAAVDPQPLNQLGEALASLEGRYTVTARNEAGRYVLDNRNSWAIEGAPAGATDRQDVYAEHECHRPIATAGHAPSAIGPPAEATTPDQPPF